MAGTPTTAEAKRLWMQAVRQHAGLNVSEFAERMEWNRSDASAMFNGTGGRGIPDEKIDEVVAKFKVPSPMATGILGHTPPAAITLDQVQELITAGKTTARLLNQVLDRVDQIAPQKT